MALATVGSCDLWLDLTAVPKIEQDDLLGAPVSVEGLFGLISAVAQCLKRLHEFSQLSHHLPLAHPQMGKVETRENNATLRRKECCCHRALVAAAAASSLSVRAATPQHSHTHTHHQAPASLTKGQ